MSETPITKTKQLAHLARIRAIRIQNLPTLHERFLKYVQKTETCWLWKGGVFETGYGALRVGGRTRRAHRVSWEIHVGPVSARYAIRRKCTEMICVNPWHHYKARRVGAR